MISMMKYIINILYERSSLCVLFSALLYISLLVMELKYGTIIREKDNYVEIIIFCMIQINLVCPLSHKGGGCVL